MCWVYTINQVRQTSQSAQDTMKKSLILALLLLVAINSYAAELFEGKYSIESILMYDKSGKKIGKITPKDKTKEFMYIDIKDGKLIYSMGKDMVINSDYKIDSVNEDKSIVVSVVNKENKIKSNWQYNDGKIVITQIEGAEEVKNVITAIKNVP